MSLFLIKYFNIFLYAEYYISYFYSSSFFPFHLLLRLFVIVTDFISLRLLLLISYFFLYASICNTYQESKYYTSYSDLSPTSQNSSSSTKFCHYHHYLIFHPPTISSPLPSRHRGLVVLPFSPFILLLLNLLSFASFSPLSSNHSRIQSDSLLLFSC